MSTLKQKAINGILWNASDRLSQQSIRFVILIILARLLLPEEFGLIGMLAIFMAMAQSLIDSGFGQALIQKKDANQVDFSSVFYLNLVLGFIMFLLIYAAAPLIAHFFNEPQLINISRFMGLIFIFHSLSLIQTTFLIKNIDFKTQTKVGIVTVTISGIIGIILAYKGFGIWSLAVQNVSMVFFRSLMLWILSKWRPAFMFNMKSIKSLFSFGSKLLVSGLLSQFFENIYYLIVGKAFDARTLGYYNQANRFQQYPSQNMTSIVENVTFPVFVQIQDDNNRLKRGFRKALKTLAYFNFPLMIGLIAIAKPLFGFLLTEKWLPAVPYFQLLCVIGVFYPIQSLNLNILKVKGRSDLLLKLEIIKKGIIIIAIAVCLPFGILALIIGQVIVTFIAYFINTYYSERFIGYGTKKQIIDIMPYLFISILMGLTVWVIGEIINLQYFPKLIIQISSGVILYYLISRLIDFEVYKESIGIFKKFWLKRGSVLIGE